jgi:hypothetical protein
VGSLTDLRSTSLVNALFPTGYCQGLNLLAATLLLIHESEENAFWTFKSTVSLLPVDFYAPSLLGSRVEQAVLEEYVEELLPEVASKLEDLGLELSAISFGWLLSMFVNCLPIEVSLSIFEFVCLELADGCWATIDGVPCMGLFLCRRKRRTCSPPPFPTHFTTTHHQQPRFYTPCCRSTCPYPL